MFPARGLTFRRSAVRCGSRGPEQSTDGRKPEAERSEGSRTGPERGAFRWRLLVPLAGGASRADVTFRTGEPHGADADPAARGRAPCAPGRGGPAMARPAPMLSSPRARVGSAGTEAPMRTVWTITSAQRATASSKTLSGQIVDCRNAAECCALWQRHAACKCALYYPAWEGPGGQSLLSVHADLGRSPLAKGFLRAR